MNKMKVQMSIVVKFSSLVDINKREDLFQNIKVGFEPHTS